MYSLPQQAQISDGSSWGNRIGLVLTSTSVHAGKGREAESRKPLGICVLLHSSTSKQIWMSLGERSVSLLTTEKCLDYTNRKTEPTSPSHWIVALFKPITLLQAREEDYRKVAPNLFSNSSHMRST